MKRKPLLTTGDIARRLGVTTQRVQAAIARIHVHPVQRAAWVRLFSEEQIPLIAQAIKGTQWLADANARARKDRNP